MGECRRRPQPRGPFHPCCVQLRPAPSYGLRHGVYVCKWLPSASEGDYYFARRFNHCSGEQGGVVPACIFTLRTRGRILPPFPLRCYDSTVCCPRADIISNNFSFSAVLPRLPFCRRQSGHCHRRPSGVGGGRSCCMVFAQTKDTVTGG